MTGPARQLLWRWAGFANVVLMTAALVSVIPPDRHQFGIDSGTAVLIGGVAIWRASWWLTHLVRSAVYRQVVYPRLAARAASIWQQGWRPQRLHILITVFREHPDTLDAVSQALCREIGRCGRPATLWIGTRDAVDEKALAYAVRRHGAGLEIDLRVVRQTLPGKRVAIGLLLRAMARQGLGANDLIAFMDSDFVIGEGALARCLPLFAADPDLHAATTDESAVVRGPAWMQSWLDMRFAQRRIAMQSHALSGRVLTLTGRFSIFRGTHVVSADFIRLVEADTLDSWLWGRYRFLSGDDKSTWYALLARGCKMLYVPDAEGYTIERVEGAGIERLVENLRRWSGNMLRNGSRAIALGPRRMPLFIWWCLVDQRLAMWTMLFGPLCALLLTIKHGVVVIVGYALYVLATRTVVAAILFFHARRIDFNFVWCLYANQLLNASVKVYILWRLPLQRWANRSDQRQAAAVSGSSAAVRRLAAVYLTAVSLTVLTIAAGAATGLIDPPMWFLLHLLGG